MTTLIVGDLHGCLREFDALLAKVPADSVVLVGDLVAKGPDSRGVVRRAREVGARAVRGNHDLRCLRWYWARRRGDELPALKPHHQRVCDTLEEDDWLWLEAQPCLLRLGDDVVVVHAGVVPGVALDAQDEDDLVSMRSLRPDGSASRRIEDGVPWASVWAGPEEVVFGHDAVRGLQIHEHATGLDTGCVYGGALTGYLLPRRELFEVPAERCYSSPGGRP